MEAASLDDFMAWNDELYALDQAGVPMDVDLGDDGADPVAALERINATVARRVSQGASLAEAVQGNAHSPTPAYASLVQAGLSSGSLAAALAGPHRLAQSLDDLWHALRVSLLYPLIVCGLAYGGLIVFCLFFFPVIESLHQELRLPTGPGLRILHSVCAMLPYWIAIPPLALLLLTFSQFSFGKQRGFSRRKATRLLGWLPGISRAIQEERWANFADTAATLLEAGASEEESLRLAGQAAGVTSELPANPARSGERDELQAAAPPFLRYALWHSDDGVGRLQALRMAAELYRAAARRRTDRIRIGAPLVLCAVLGGSVTLLYGLALFVPVVEMLTTLAN
jgi:type II secretory pathway component PulF